MTQRDEHSTRSVPWGTGLLPLVLVGGAVLRIMIGVTQKPGVPSDAVFRPNLPSIMTKEQGQALMQQLVQQQSVPRKITQLPKEAGAGSLAHYLAVCGIMEEWRGAVARAKTNAHFDKQKWDARQMI